MDASAEGDGQKMSSEQQSVKEIPSNICIKSTVDSKHCSCFKDLIHRPVCSGNWNIIHTFPEWLSKKNTHNTKDGQ